MQAILMRTEQTIIRVISRKILKKILEQLSLKYGFNSLEAFKRMNDSADVSDDVSVKKRGRPCKVKGTRESSGDDLIASLIADVKMQNPTPVLPVEKSKSSYLECDDYDDDDIEDEETIEVTRFQYGGIQYYKNTNNNDLYDINTNDVIGRWNESSKSIECIK
jgi:hypothetical protein